MAFTSYLQFDEKDCGPACVRMVAKHYGKNYSISTLREKCNINRQGVSLLGISQAAENIGFDTLGARLTLEQLKDALLPCIVFWQQKHFVVVYKIKRGNVYVADPAHGLLVHSEEDFLNGWIIAANSGKREGLCLLLEPKDEFYQEEDEPVDQKHLTRLFGYFLHYKKLLLQLLVAILFASALQITLPFLTQSIVDKGINSKNINFITIILVAQLVLFLSRASVDLVRTWILLHITSRINLTIISNFLYKLLRLPLSFFDTKKIGDILQRTQDQSRIEHFLTGSSTYALFALLNLLIFSIVLIQYNGLIFIVFLLGSILYLLWIALFIKRKKTLDTKHFKLVSKNHDHIIQMVSGMQEIKVNNSERNKRWDWEKLQASIFRLNMQILAFGQYQTAGGGIINESKNILITYLAATSVVENKITLGAMLAIQYIIGQLNGPIDQISQFMLSYQEAKLSLERLAEIETIKDEESKNSGLLEIDFDKEDIILDNVNFSYPGTSNRPVLKNINLVIPNGKTTAIVGMSGSGKTTLLKLLLKFYDPDNGAILCDTTNLNCISHKRWRSHCGVVMQDGYIFSDSIAKNIALGYDEIDYQRLVYAAKIANIQDYVESLPLSYNSVVGMDGSGLSQGQKQRLLIARSVYKNPNLFFFDEATNALDATNETVIMKNLQQLFTGKTVIIIAHRLSTVKKADKIVVLEKGVIIEEGRHEALIRNKSVYYNLVKDQLELGE
ncbi:peptidase domain-containing ABC transporter [Mucilaginibacter sp.]|uniref:peptidase domain-containing ABC transporter n=1 Tax=Mucilaginibacter sp. TaxID=1882438 RepID=UPI0025D591B1|nr:peptidase domain-containing ABC transporter [Mucilaginibacter sp.]